MKDTFLVVGLSTFGLQTAQALYKGGAMVMAVDGNPDIIDRVQGSISKAVCADVTNEEALLAVGAFDVNVAILGLRRHFDTSVLATYMLKKRNVRTVCVQVDTEQEGQAIRAVGADHVIFPERDMAERLAQRLLRPELADQIPLGENVGLVEVPCPPSFVGKTLLKLNIRKRFGVTVIALKYPPKVPGGREIVEVAPAPDEELKKGCGMVIIGKTEHLSRFRKTV